MAERKKKSKKKKVVATDEMASPSGMDALYLVCGLVSLTLAAYTLIALTSYLFTWAEDQSLLSDEGLLGTVMQVENNGGQIGLVWADFLISKLFGLGAFVVPFFFGGVALFCFRIKRVKLLRLLFLSLFGCFILSLAFSYIFSFTKVDALFSGGAGGSYGHYINDWLITKFGGMATGAIIVIAIIVWLIALNRRFVDMFNRFIDKITSIEFKRKKKSEPEVDERAAIADGSDVAGMDGAAADDGVDKNGGSGKDDEEEQEGDEPEEDDSGDNDSENDDSEGGSDDLSYEEKSGKDGERKSGDGEIILTVKDDEGQDDDGGIIELSENGELKVMVEGAPEAPPVNDRPGAVVKKGGDEEEDFLSQIPEDEALKLFDPRLDIPWYKAPTLNLLEDYRDKWYEVSPQELEKNKKEIEKTLGNFKIGIQRVSACIGPTVTLYKVVPGVGVRVSQIKKLEQDIQLSLKAKGVRVVTLPGSDAIGIEVANEKSSVVSMLSLLDDKNFREKSYDLPVALGRTITNEVLSFDLAKMPHLLVAGATGQGKSVGLNVILASLLYTKHPSELKLVLVDPKKVELSLYSKLEKHFLAQLPDADEPVITDTQKVVYTLKSLCQEMDTRYDLLKVAGVRNIKQYNEKFLQRRLNPLKGHRFLPYIVVVIDEFADLLMTAGKEIEMPIARLAQLARAIGIHLVIATQRPTTQVITGNIKANFPARIAFMVRSQIDSRTILDEVGANQLIGRGDMLISNGGDLTRVQCALIETDEVERIVDYIGNQRGYQTAYYLPEYTGDEKDGDDGGSGVGAVDLSKRDPLFEKAAELIVLHQQGSTSLIQRKMNIGYNRSGRIIDQLEVAGIVGPSEGSKARQVLVGDLIELEARLSNIREIYG